MKTELDTMEAAGLDMEAMRQRLEFMNSLQEIGPEGRENRLAFLRALSELARENTAARSIVERLLDGIRDKRLQEKKATFRAYYLEGDTKTNARQTARRLCMDPATVYRHIRRILSEMLPLAFGIYGVYKADSEWEAALKAAISRQETAQGAGEG